MSGIVESSLFATYGSSLSRISCAIELSNLECLASDSTTKKFAARNSSTCLDLTASHYSVFDASISIRAGFANFCLNEDELSISLKTKI